MAFPEYVYCDIGAECPYCHYVNTPANSDYILYDESLDSYECGSCEREFIVSAYKSWSWTTKPINE